MKNIVVVTNSFANFRRHVQDDVDEIVGASLTPYVNGSGVAAVNYSDGSTASFRLVRRLNDARGMQWYGRVGLIDYNFGYASIINAEEALEYIEAKYFSVSAPTEFPKSIDEI